LGPPRGAKKAKAKGRSVRDEIDDEPMIEMSFPLCSLRLMHHCAERALQTWPGGDPFEQMAIDNLRQALYVALYSTLYEIDEI